MESSITSTTTITVLPQQGQGFSVVPSPPSTRPVNYDVNNDHPAILLQHTHDNDLLTRPAAPTSPTSKLAAMVLDECAEAALVDEQEEDADEEEEKRSHVSPMSDSVAESPLARGGRKPRRPFVKSKTCCDFFCNCPSTTAQAQEGQEQPLSRPITIRRPTTLDRTQLRKKLFPSFSHPDTSFVFTEDELLPILARSPADKDPVTSPVFSGSNRRHWRRRDTELELSWSLSGSPVNGSRDLGERKKISVVRSCSENQLGKRLQLTGDYAGDDFKIIPVHPEISIKVRTRADSESANEPRQFSPTADRVKIDATACDSVVTTPSGANEGQLESDAERQEGKRSQEEVLEAAQRFFEESGILGPVTPSIMGNSLFRKNSKVHVLDGVQFEQIRKQSRTVLKADKVKAKTLTRAESTPVESNGYKNAAEELSNLRELLKLRDNEIVRLKREIHKLKSVLQQTSEAPIETDLVSRIQTPTDVGDAPTEDAQKAVVPMAPPLHSLLHPGATKKQGVSAESSDNKQYSLKAFTIETHEKDFKSKQLIKDAILDNDFLKHLTSSQIKKLVESMFLKKIARGEYVIREGDYGAHLYISDEGQFEVIKDNVVLGKMGPGKAFGELAILYNCKRTASIKALTDSKVWVLDRRAFQQIGMQRIEENISFLRSVPLLKNLGTDALEKIADTLELEFYPTGTYIIRQDTSGDSFFLISQGNVAVTQRLPGTKIEEEIRVLGRGDYFGEQALIKEDKRTANIIALSPGVECLTLDRDAFRKFIGELSELHEIDYKDQDRATSFRENEKEALRFSRTQNHQLLHINLHDLEVVATLGVGGFGRVELVKYSGSSSGGVLSHGSHQLETYALKCLKKQHIVDTQQQEHLYNERSIMMACDSPFVCRLYRTYKDDKYVYMLMEACLGGEIWTILRNRGYFDEYRGQFIVGCVLEAFQYLHSRGIVYRDTKPENLILDANGYVKLIDFGFAKYIGHSSRTWTFCGTPEYVAPEVILNKGHDRAVDYWALGILIYELLTGVPPFTSSDQMKTYNIILKNVIEFPNHMSKTAVHLIKSLCRDVPAERLGYQKGVPEIKKHKWFQGFDWDELAAQTMPSPILNIVDSPIDTSNFDVFPDDVDEPPDEFSGWDAEF